LPDVQKAGAVGRKDNQLACANGGQRRGKETMKTIWKWTLRPETTINMPHGAKLLAVQEQRGEAQLWALVDPGAKTYPRTFRVYGTGHDLPDDPGQYVGTFQMNGGALVFHVFEASAADNMRQDHPESKP
jgi:hypothetical protein